jgi:hypothetical protein
MMAQVRHPQSQTRLTKEQYAIEIDLETGEVSTNNNSRNVQTRFERREPSLQGFIYDATGERNPYQYIKTTKEIVNYVGRTYTKFT